MKTSLIQKMSLFIAMILFTFSSQALMEVREAQLAVRDAQKSCPELNCEQSRAQVNALSNAQISKLDPSTQKFLRTAAKTFAENQWPDTILESSYVVDFKVQVDAVEVLKVDGEPVGYRVSFSTPAWNQEECPAFTDEEMAEKSAQELIREKCAAGRIHDRTFAVPNPSGIFDDEKFRPEFH